MSMQCIFDFTPKQQEEGIPIIQALAWLDVTDIARGVSFTTAEQVSNILNEALQPGHKEVGDYDQTPLRLSLACSPSVLARPRSIQNFPLRLPAQG